ESRYKCGSSVVVDMIGYGRQGHSEVDDPTITHPLWYKAIKEHPPLWEIYGEDTGIADAQSRADSVKEELEAAQKRASSVRKKPLMRSLPGYWDNFTGGRYKKEYDAQTAIPADELAQLTRRLTT